MMTFFCKSIFQFREWADKNGVKVIDLKYFSVVWAAYLAIFLSKTAIHHYCWDFVFKHLHPRYTGHERVMRARKIIKWIFDSIYYTSTTVFL